MKHIIRELGKVSMFTIIWAAPILLSHLSGSNWFLLFFILSCVVTVGIFAHYEELEELDKSKGDNDESNEW